MSLAHLRDLEKYEENALAQCIDPEYREKLRIWVQKKKGPLDDYDLKKLKDKIEKHARNM
jgi:acyl-CoA hydrolase